jgi:predicted HTH transcriptional regulator
MDILSPARTCDPWAVHSAKTFIKKSGAPPEINETQVEILRILQESGGTEFRTLLRKLPISASDLEREIAALRHMEKVRGQLKEGRKILRLW